MQSETPGLPSGVREGEVVAGKYLIEKVIGTGAVGVIVSARHLLLDERIAIKFLLPQAMGTGDAVKRFVQEARAAVRMRSEYTVRVRDVALLESGSPYIVMEYLEGKDLAAVLTTSGALPVERAVEFVLQACEALAEAHGFGVVHRDLKPANLFVVCRADGVEAIKVLDFGISKMQRMEADEVGLTNRNVLLGSPLYMSPEQMESSTNVDARTDIWALGVVLFELCTGDVPYTADSLPQLYARILSKPEIAFPAGKDRLPPVLEAVIRKCLAQDREARFANVGELAEALGPLASTRALTSVRRLSTLARTWAPAATPTPPDSSDVTPSNAMPRPSAASVGDLRASPSGSERGGSLSPRGGPGKSRALAAGGVVALVAAALLVRASSAPRPMHVEIDSTKPPLTSVSSPGVSAYPITEPVAPSPAPVDPVVGGVPAAPSAASRAHATLPALPPLHRPLLPRPEPPKPKDDLVGKARAAAPQDAGLPTTRAALPGALSGSD